MFDSFDSSPLPISKSERDDKTDGLFELFQNQEIDELKKNCFSIFKKILLRVEPDIIISKDLPRLANNITIQNSKEHENIIKSAHKILYNLSEFLNSDKLIEPEKFEEMLIDLKSEHQHLHNFLLEYYGKDSKEMLILRSITQKALAQPMIYVKKLLNTVGISFGDKKWKIDIKRENEYIQVIHTRKEKIDSKIPESDESIHYKILFTFSWKIIIFIKETKEGELKFDKARFEFVSLDDFDETIVGENELKENDLIEIFKKAFATISDDFDLNQEKEEIEEK